MCGLSAVVTLKRNDQTAASSSDGHDDAIRENLESKLRSSLDAIAHRGPDAQDVWINPENTVALGHCRLSIVDLSPGGNQPLHDDEGQIHAVVMGEIYDDERLREQCIRDFGYTFSGHSDSEVVLALYKHYGAPAFLDHLRGEFAFIIYDDRTGQIVAARDRFGIKPIFWTIVDDKILFAAEMKAFLPLDWKPEWNVDSIILNSCFHGSQTIFKGVSKIEPGHYMTVSSEGAIEHHEYWDLNYRDKHHIETRPVEEMVLEVREKLLESIRLRLRADVPVGIYLSGGLDSSAVAGITKFLVEEQGVKMGKDTKNRIACFSIMFDKESGIDESDIAERTAKHLGVEMFKKDMNEAELARHFEDCTWHNEHHLFDLGPVGKFALSELPREHGFKVILSGEGADEIFAGYPWFVPEFLLEPDYSQPELVLQKDSDLRETLKRNSVDEMLTSIGNFIASNNGPSADPVIAEQVNHVLAPEMFSTRIMYNEMLTESLENKYSSTDKAQRLIDDFSPSALEKIQHNWHPMHTSMYSWVKSNLANFLLTALGDRAEMAHSIEGRPPFLDHQLAELMGNISPSLKMYYGSDVTGPDSSRSPFWSQKADNAACKFWEKWILREAAKPFITEELYVRRKHPYSAPFMFASGGPMHQLFRMLLTKENIDAIGFLSWPATERYLKEAFEGKVKIASFRKCITIACFVTLSQRFNVATAKVEANGHLN